MENSINNNNFISSKDDNDEEHLMHSKSDNIEIMISHEADEVIKKFFDPLKNRYQNNLQLMRDSEFVFDYVQLLYYKCLKNKFQSWWIIYRFSLLDKKQKSTNKSHL